MKKEIEIINISCHICGKEVYGHTHTCPFRQEIAESDTECNCCSECIYQCAMDI